MEDLTAHVQACMDEIEGQLRLDSFEREIVTLFVEKLAIKSRQVGIETGINSFAETLTSMRGKS